MSIPSSSDNVTIIANATGPRGPMGPPMPSFASIDALRAATFQSPPAETEVLVQGYRAGSLLGGGIFVFNSSGGEDNGVTVIVSADGKAWDRIIDGPLSVYAFGTYGDNTHDDTSAIVACLEFGGSIRVQAGQFLIANAGPDAGGVFASLSRDTQVICDAGAIFLPTQLDNDAIRVFPSTLTSQGINFSWLGGLIDQRLQKNSTSIPFSSTFPPVNPGASATCDGLSVRGVIAGASGFGNVTIIGLQTIASNGSWQTAGGDGSIYADGFKKLLIDTCTHKASRDAAHYISRDSTGAAGDNFEVRGCEFDQCVFGVAAKRGITRGRIHHNNFDRCVIPVQCNVIVGTGDSQVIIDHNTAREFWYFCRLQGCNQVLIAGNEVQQVGYLLDDGSMPSIFSNPRVLLYSGATYCVSRGNITYGATAGYENTAQYYTYEQFTMPDSSIVNTTNCEMRDEFFIGLHGPGGETTGQADFNAFLFNRPLGATVPGMGLAGANSIIVAAGTTDGILSAGGPDLRSSFQVVAEDTLAFTAPGAGPVKLKIGLQGGPVTNQISHELFFNAHDDAGSPVTFAEIFVITPSVAHGAPQGELRFLTVGPAGTLIPGLSVFYDRVSARLPLQIPSLSPGSVSNPTTGNIMLFYSTSTNALSFKDSSGTVHTVTST